jgi:carbamoyltransferase
VPPTSILGISGLYHDAAAALVVDGEVVAAVQEERFTRHKHDPSFPVQAIAWCLERGGVRPGELDVVAYYEKPLASFSRVLRSQTAAGWRARRTFPKAARSALRSTLWVGYQVDRALQAAGHPPSRRTVYAEHHLSHAAAAFYPSPFEDAAILTFDGVGEWATSSIGVGHGGRIDLLQELRFPASIGLLYSAFTAAAGFRVNSGEYKLMGLAPFGEPRYRERILDELIDLRDDGSFTIDVRLIDYVAGERMINDRFAEVFGGPPRSPSDPIDQRTCDLARSAQDVIEEIVLRVARHAHALTGLPRAVLAGGVALNCVANGRLVREGPFDDVWVQPAAGDAGSALGCALWAWHEVLGEERPAPGGADAMAGALLGPTPLGADGSSASAWAHAAGLPHEHLADPVERSRRIAACLAAGEVVAVCAGAMEFGPRSLGNRSILADARDPAMQQRLNGTVKHREGFRPFAPIVLEERTAEWFELDRPSPYMSLVAAVRGASTSTTETADGAASGQALDLAERLAAISSPIPAVTHVDGTARIQTVDRHRNPELRRILEAFDDQTGCPVLVNTSFNVRGEPIVATADDAYRCFMATDIDRLLVEDCLLTRADQPPWTGPAPATIPD